MEKENNRSETDGMVAVEAWKGEKKVRMRN